MKALTRQQKRLLDFIVTYVDEHGFAPSVREAGAACGWSSTSTTHSHLMALVEKGYVEPVHERLGGLRIVREAA